MYLEIDNIKLNFIKQKLKIVENTYFQSNDNNIRICVKNANYIELCNAIPGFYESFGEIFEKCQMRSLNEIVELQNTILRNVDVEKMKILELKELKKILKIKERELKQIVKGYNETIDRIPITYYSHIIDEKMILLLNQDNEYNAIVGNISRDRKPREKLCGFCKQFRRGEEIVFVTSTIKKQKNQLSTIGQYICSDSDKCNASIISTDNLYSFMNYGKIKVKK